MACFSTMSWTQLAQSAISKRCHAHRVAAPLQISSLSDAALAGTDKSEREHWLVALKRTRGHASRDEVLDWVENKPRRVLLLCRQHLVYVRWDGVTPASSRERWSLHLEHISSVTKVAHTIVVMCSETAQLGPLRLDVPRRRCLASENDNMAELLLHRVNQALDAHFKQSAHHKAREHASGSHQRASQVRSRAMMPPSGVLLSCNWRSCCCAHVAHDRRACTPASRHSHVALSAVPAAHRLHPWGLLDSSGGGLQRVQLAAPDSLYTTLQTNHTVSELRTRTLSASSASCNGVSTSGAAPSESARATDAEHEAGDDDWQYGDTASGARRRRWQAKAQRLKAKALEASARVAAAVSSPKTTWNTWKHAQGAIAPLAGPKYLDLGASGSPVRAGGALTPVVGVGSDSDVLRLIRDDLAAAITPEECVFATDLSFVRAQAALEAWQGPTSQEYAVLHAIARLCRSEVQGSKVAAINSCRAALRFCDSALGVESTTTALVATPHVQGENEPAVLTIASLD